MTAPLRITFVEFGTTGGLLHYSGQLADALARRGHDVTLLTGPDHEIPDRLDSVTIDTRLASFDPRRGRASGRAGRVVQRASRAVVLLRAWHDVADYVDQHRPHVLVTSELRFVLDAAAVEWLSRRRSAAALVNICHNVRPFDVSTSGDGLFRTGPLLRRALRRAYSRMSLVAVHGDESRRQFADYWDVRTPVVVIPHGDERIFGGPLEPTDGRPTILFFGTWSRYKGLDVLLDAFASVRERVPDARLEVVGYPSKDADTDAIMRRCAAFGDAVRVDARYVPIDEAREAFARATVVVLPYRAGFQSGVAHLALTLQRPVVATRVGDIGGVVEAAGAGTVVPPEDPRALADALAAMLEDPGRAAEMGRRGRAWLMAESSWDVAAQRLEGALAHAVARRRGGQDASTSEPASR